MCLFYFQIAKSEFVLMESGIHLLSHAVSSIVSSAAKVLTIVFGMGTGVSPKRIDTGNLSFPGLPIFNCLSLKTQQYIKPLLLLP